MSSFWDCHCEKAERKLEGIKCSALYFIDAEASRGYTGKTSGKADVELRSKEANYIAFHCIFLCVAIGGA